MITRVDWISFSILVAPQPDAEHFDMSAQCLDALEHMHNSFPDWLQIDQSWTFEKGRAPYAICFRRADNGVSIYAHRNLSHALVEISGRGCDQLHSQSLISHVLQFASDRLTRVDLACDMHCDTRPLEFIAQRDAGRFKSHSEVVSPSGETCYIGSKTSDRYARVYRYNEPHERAHLLRCEFVVKAENAKNLAAAIVNDGESACAITLGNAFGWMHDAWVFEDETPAEIAVWRPERREGKTLFWLADTIAPLLARLHNEGVLDLGLWLTEHVTPLILPSNDE